MNAFLFSAVVIGGLFAVGCVEAPTLEKVGDTTEESGQAATASKKADGTKEDPSSATGSPSRAGKLEAEPASDQSAYAEPCNNGWWGCEKTLSCTGTANGNQSVARLTYVTNGGAVQSLSVVASNAANLDKNDVAISVKGPTDSQYLFVFRSAEILADGETVSVPLPTDFRVPAGSSIQIDTKFESSGSAIGGTATCFVQL